MSFWCIYRLIWICVCDSLNDRATLQGVIIPSAILQIVFRHILLFWFFNAVWALTSGGFRIVSDTLVINYFAVHE